MADIAELFPQLQEMSTADLLARRRALIGDRKSLFVEPMSDEELDELSAINTLLRRKASGPPREKPEKASRASKQKGLSLDDLAVD
jgi:hypothetical protein